MSSGKIICFCFLELNANRTKSPLLFHLISEKYFVFLARPFTDSVADQGCELNAGTTFPAPRRSSLVMLWLELYRPSLSSAMRGRQREAGRLETEGLPVTSFDY